MANIIVVSVITPSGKKIGLDLTEYSEAEYTDLLRMLEEQGWQILSKPMRLMSPEEFEEKLKREAEGAE